MINSFLLTVFSYNRKDWIFLIGLLILTAITVHIISWCGGVIERVSNSGLNYAVFTFRMDQDQGMSANIIMNILIPNVCLVFLSMTCYYIEKLTFGRKLLIFYVIGYYLYRAILICALLNRKEYII